MNSSLYTKQRHLFKAYDIRGARKFFNEPFVQALSQVFAKQYIANLAKIVVIGHDMRHGSFAIAQCLAETISLKGIDVIWLGLVTTPIMAFWAQEYEGHGIIATASHSEGHINGLKWLMAGESPSSEDIEQLYNQLILNTSKSGTVDVTLPFFKPLPKPQTKPLSKPQYKSITLPPMSNCQLHPANDSCLDSINSTSSLVASKSTAIPYSTDVSKVHSIPSCKRLEPQHVADKYFNAVKSALNLINYQQEWQTNQQSSNSLTLNHSHLSIVIDCLHGATGLFSRAFFSQFDNFVAKVHIINATPDGSFPKGNPDPTESGRLTELQDAVLHYNADIGLSFDGDGDRLMVVDNFGRVVEPDHLLYLLAQIAIKDKTITDTSTLKPMSDPTVIFDVKCSHHLPTMIHNIGATPQMSKTGSSIMRKALQTGESNAIFAGELSGHFLFNDGYFILHDDAMYAGLRLLNWLSYQSSPLSDIVDNLPSMVTTPDVYLPIMKDNNEKNPDNTIFNKLASLCRWLQRYCSLNLNQTIAETNTHVFGSDPCASKECTLRSHTCDTHIPNPKSLAFDNKMALSTSELALPKNTRLTCIDGIRLDFNDGFGVIRPSNTSQSLTVRFAGNTLDDLRKIQQRFVKLFEPIDHDLAQLIAQINPSN